MVALQSSWYLRACMATPRYFYIKNFDLIRYFYNFGSSATFLLTGCNIAQDEPQLHSSATLDRYWPLSPENGPVAVLNNYPHKSLNIITSKVRLCENLVGFKNFSIVFFFKYYFASVLFVFHIYIIFLRFSASKVSNKMPIL